MHWITDIDPTARTATCSRCGPVGLRSKGGGRWGCARAHQARKRAARKPYQASRTMTCSRCGFEAEDECQMDVDHIDSDHTNDAPENLQTLCANCHRLKSKERGDWG